MRSERRSPNLRPSIGIAGTYGIPAKHGGFETFAAELAPRLAAKGFDVRVYCGRDPSAPSHWRGVTLRHLAITKASNPLRYYAQSIHRAVQENDVVLVTGTGGSFFYPVNWVYRRRLYTNTDGVESLRGKWSAAKRIYVALSERFAVKWSTGLVADSEGILRYLQRKYGGAVPATVIEYGAPLNETRDDALLARHQLNHGRYHLVICRFEPENNVDLIIRGYRAAGCRWPLILLGKLNDTPYCHALAKQAGPDVRFLGAIYDDHTVRTLRASANSYLHGHSVGGTNPSLLESLGSGTPSLCHDNEFNREVAADAGRFFSTVSEVAGALRWVESLDSQERDELKRAAVARITDRYNWERISDLYAALFTGTTAAGAPPSSY